MGYGVCVSRVRVECLCHRDEVTAEEANLSNVVEGECSRRSESLRIIKNSATVKFADTKTKTTHTAYL